MNKYVKYNHHGAEVMVREDLKGKHRDHCLCFACKKANLFDADKSNKCKIADAIYQNCVKFNLVTPVFECPEFEEK